MSGRKSPIPSILDVANSIPKSKDMAMAIIGAFGGMDKIAIEFKTMYDHTATTPATKVKMLEWFFRLTQVVGTAGLSDDDMDGMTNEELEHLYHKLEKANAKKPKKPPRPKPGHIPSSTTDRGPTRLDADDTPPAGE